MIAKKRLAKRSIIGTRIAAPGHDGRFYPGVIESTKTAPDGRSIYTIRSKNGSCKEVTDGDIIGPGFHSISSFVLKPEQKVYLTYQGREISGFVIRHQPHIDEVLVKVDASSIKNSPNASPTEDTLQVRKRVDEIRILESRKSSRLVDQDKDFARFADIGLTKAPAAAAAGVMASPLSAQQHQASSAAVASSISGLGRKRSVSNCIDVPHSFVKAQRRRKRHLSAPGPGEDESVGPIGEVSSDTSSDEDEDDVEVMDEKMAALVLTTLSCSPVSPKVLNIPGNILHHGEGGPLSGSWTSGSSSYWSGKSEEIMNESPASAVNYLRDPQSKSATMNSPVDEGIELYDNFKKRNKVRIIYQCTWPGCVERRKSCPAIEKHVRQTHLGPKPERTNSDDSDDHEEEFYYTEIEMVESESPESPSATSSSCLTSSSRPMSSSQSATSQPLFQPEKIRTNRPVLEAAKQKQPSSTSPSLSLPPGSSPSLSLPPGSSPSLSLPLGPSSPSSLSLSPSSVAEVQRETPPSHLHPNKASNLPHHHFPHHNLSPHPGGNSLSPPCPTIVHATPSTDHDYTAKIQNTSTLSYRSVMMPSPQDKSFQDKKDHLIDVFMAMEQAKLDQPLFLGSSQGRQLNPQQLSQLRLAASPDAYSMGNLATDSSSRNITWSAQGHPTLTGNISLPKPIRPNMVPPATGTAITYPSFTGSFPGTHYQGSFTHNSPKMIISTSLGVSSGGIGKPHTKKIRGEMKKCRKVYGMENRDMWCTQCRWKKACTRFTD